MASDGRDSLLDLVRTRVLTVADIGNVFRHLPHWMTVGNWEKDTKAIVNAKSVHRFWTIDHHAKSEVHSFGAAKGTDLVTHVVSITGYVAALIDKEDEGAGTEQEARNLAGAVISALRNPDDISPDTTFCGYAIDQLPQEADDLDLVSVWGQDFHQPSIELGILQEVAR